MEDFEEVYRRYFADVYKYVLALSRDEAVAEENAWAESQGIDREVTRVWYGRGEDAILLWEEGMDLPAAGEADEAAWGYESGSADYWAQRK